MVGHRSVGAVGVEEATVRHRRRMARRRVWFVPAAWLAIYDLKYDSHGDWYLVVKWATRGAA